LEIVLHFIYAKRDLNLTPIKIFLRNFGSLIKVFTKTNISSTKMHKNYANSNFLDKTGDSHYTDNQKLYKHANHFGKSDYHPYKAETFSVSCNN
jgi:hypothetical protein